MKLPAVTSIVVPTTIFPTTSHVDPSEIVIPNPWIFKLFADSSKTFADNATGEFEEFNVKIPFVVAKSSASEMPP